MQSSSASNRVQATKSVFSEDDWELEPTTTIKGMHLAPYVF